MIQLVLVSGEVLTFSTYSEFKGFVWMYGDNTEWIAVRGVLVNG
jgi:hypothetical protein